jgi:hypothetical protein
MECSICCSDFNKSTKKEIICESCNEHVCKSCVVNWLNERTNITCPSCNVNWSFEFCYDNITKTMMKSYEIIHKEIIYKIEQQYFPESQVFVKINEMYQQYEKEYEYLKNFIKLNDDKSHDCSKDENIMEILRKLNIDKPRPNLTHLKNAKILLKRNIDIINMYVNTHHNLDILNNALNMNVEIIKKHVENKKICSCPNLDCKGTIMSMDYECGICQIKICKKCHVIENDIHICKQEDIDTIKMIYNDSKPCPKCSERISKIDGCDQMYCVECKTAFSWKTGKIETGRIHNPHYYEDLRRIHNGNIPREQGDDPHDDCQDPIPILYDDIHIILLKKSLSCSRYVHRNIQKYNNIHRKYMHTSAHLVNLNNNENIDFNTNFLYRYKYINNQISEEKFKSLIYANYKKLKYEKEIFLLITEFQNISKVILKEMHKNITGEELYPNENVFINMYQIWKDINDKYNIRYKNISEYFGYTPQEKNYFFYFNE